MKMLHMNAVLDERKTEIIILGIWGIGELFESNIIIYETKCSLNANKIFR